MENILESATYVGVTIDFIFENEKPMFGDLFLICGYSHPNFPPSGNLGFGKLSSLNFSQVDDYFGLRNMKREGDDVIIWLYPLIGDKDVYHHPGPFTGLRLSYDVLRNPIRYISIFLKVVTLFAQHLDVKVIYRLRHLNLGQPPDMTLVEEDINQIVKFWQRKNIKPGSKAALRITY
jgi:hypothetical protein